MLEISYDIASGVRLAKNEIVLGSCVPLARRVVKDGRFHLERLDARPMAALLQYACSLSASDADRCVEKIGEAAGLIGRDDETARARLRALSLRATVKQEDIDLAYRLARLGMDDDRLADEVRLAKLGLTEPPRYCERLTLCRRGVILGNRMIVAPLVKMPNGHFGLAVEGREAQILALLSAARGAPAPVQTIERLHSVSRALQCGDRIRAEFALALAIGSPVLPDPPAAERLAKVADGLDAASEPHDLVNRHEMAPPLDKASPDDPNHPGWPKGEPDGRGGQFRPKTDAERFGVGGNNGPPLEEESPVSRNVITRTLAAAIWGAIRGGLRGGLAGLAAGAVSAAAFPHVKAYFDPPKSLEDLQQAAQSPPEIGYDDHHIVEQATAAADGSEDALIAAPENLVRIPKVKHWELNKWYETARPRFNDMTPRQYLKRRSWDERSRVGLEGLREVGVLQ